MAKNHTKHKMTVYDEHLSIGDSLHKDIFVSAKLFVASYLN